MIASRRDRARRRGTTEAEERSSDELCNRFRGARRLRAALATLGVELLKVGLSELESPQPSLQRRGEPGAARPSDQRPALATIWAMVEASQVRGFLSRALGAPEDRASPKCELCRRHAAKPMQPADVRDVRRAVRRAGLHDAVAYAFAKTTVLLTISSRFRWCSCDIEAWRRAIEEYGYDRRAAWRSLGVHVA